MKSPEQESRFKELQLVAMQYTMERIQTGKVRESTLRDLHYAADWYMAQVNRDRKDGQ